MRRLWEFNTRYPKEQSLQSVSRKRKNHGDGDGSPNDVRWAGYKVRQMLLTLYITSMLCLLRYDEALRVMWHQVHLETDTNGTPIVRLELPFRKTDQTGCMSQSFRYNFSSSESDMLANWTVLQRRLQTLFYTRTKIDLGWTLSARSVFGGNSALTWESS